MPWVVMILSAAVASVTLFVGPLDRSVRASSYFLMLTLIILVSGIRYKTGYDFDNYADMYSYISAGGESEGVEWGWRLICQTANLLFNSPLGVFLLSALLIYGLIGSVLYFESDFSAVAMMAFLLNLQFYWESLSILRQYVAMAICLMAGWLWIRGNKTAFLAAVAVATAFHVTAIVALVIPALSWWRFRVAYVLAMVVVAVVTSVVLSDLIMYADLFSKYQAYFDGTIAAEGNEKSGLVVYARAVVALLIIVFVDRLPALDQQRKNLVFNAVVLSYALFFALYSSTALRRIAYYFLVYELFAIGYLAQAGTRERRFGVRFGAWGVVVAYLLLNIVLLTHDVWTNPLGRQEDSQYNYQYRTILE